MQDNWISVKERLPEKSEHLMGFDDEFKPYIAIENYQATVLAYNEYLGVFKAIYTNRGWVEVSSISSKGGVKPTHWQPIFPPKD